MTMSRTGLALDVVFERHITADGHPERPDRIAAVRAVLERTGETEKCVALDITPIDRDAAAALHEPQYLDRVENGCAGGKAYIDTPDCSVCPETFEIAKLAAGTAVAAVDRVMSQEIDNAFCAIRPPGHHAEKHMAMGFCYLNSIALAADHLRRTHGLERILILDWDVHHGNGTQHIFEADADVLFISIHGHPGIVFPGTGYAEETGKGEGKGFTLNIPMLPPSSDDEWKRAYDVLIRPRIDEFAPEFVLLSAGFDGHARDPLAPLELSTELFGWLTDRVCETAAQHCGGRLVSVLEGGYDLGSLSECVSLHVERLRAVSTPE